MLNVGFELPFTTCRGYGGGDNNYDSSVNCGDTAEVKWDRGIDRDAT